MLNASLSGKGISYSARHPPPLRIVIFRRVIVHNFVTNLINMPAKVNKKNENTNFLGTDYTDFTVFLFFSKYSRVHPYNPYQNTTFQERLPTFSSRVPRRGRR